MPSYPQTRSSLPELKRRGACVWKLGFDERRRVIAGLGPDCREWPVEDAAAGCSGDQADESRPKPMRGQRQQARPYCASTNRPSDSLNCCAGCRMSFCSTGRYCKVRVLSSCAGWSGSADCLFLGLSARLSVEPADAPHLPLICQNAPTRDRGDRMETVQTLQWLNGYV